MYFRFYDEAQCTSSLGIGYKLHAVIPVAGQRKHGTTFRVVKVISHVATPGWSLRSLTVLLKSCSQRLDWSNTTEHSWCHLMNNVDNMEVGPVQQHSLCGVHVIGRNSVNKMSSNREQLNTYRQTYNNKLLCNETICPPPHTHPHPFNGPFRGLPR